MKLFRRKLVKKFLITTQAFNSVSGTVGKLGANTRRLNENLGLAMIKINRHQDYFSTLRELANNPNVNCGNPILWPDLPISNDPYYGQRMGSRQQLPKLSTGQLSDLETPGFDNDSGYGLLVGV